jgi:hypothetical protein
VLTLTGCTWIGLMRSEDQSFTGKDSLSLQASRPDILDLIAEVGTSMGYRVLDKEANIIRLSSSSSLFKTDLLGKMSEATLRISANNDGTKLDIDVFVSGNFGTGSQEAATQLVNDFKARLLEAVARANASSPVASETEKEPSSGSKPEASKADTLTQKDAPPPLSVSALEETKAAPPALSVPSAKEAKADKPSSPLEGKKLVSIKAANVRAMASMKGKIIRTLRKGDEVEYLGKSGNWINVKLSSGAIGWVYNNLLKDK